MSESNYPITFASGFMLRTLVVTLWGLFLSIGTAAESELRLKATRGIYHAKLDQIDKEHDKQISSLLAKYRNALAGLKDHAQKEGNLQGVLGVQTELERLGKEHAPPAGAALSSQEGLREKQDICAKSARDAELAKSQKIVELAGEYTGQLVEEKKRLTIAGDFDAAKAYADEIERVTRGEKENAASLVVQAKEKEETNATDGSGTAAATVDCRIYEDAPPPPIEGVVMKQQSMLGTRLAGRISQVTASAQIGTVNNMEVRRSTYSKTESGKIEMLLRLELKTQPQQQAIRDALALVQYFGTDAAARGIVRPKQIAAEPVRLAALSSKSVTIDFPGIDITKYEYRSRSSNYTSKSGQDFHGLMVTVFGKDNEIIYQAVTSPSLQDQGESALAEVKLAQGRIDLRAARAVYERARDAYHTGAVEGDRADLLRRYQEARTSYYELRRRLEK